MTRDDSWNYADVLWNGIQAKAVTAAFEQLSYKEQWYLEKRNAICMTCGRVSPLSTQSTFEDTDFCNGSSQIYSYDILHIHISINWGLPFTHCKDAENPFSKIT